MRYALAGFLEEEASPSAAVREILSAFPDETKLTDGRVWMPLPWAAAIIDEIGEEAVKTIYLSNPMALKPFSDLRRKGGIECNPLHILCMCPEPNLNLLRYFATVNPWVFDAREANILPLLHTAAGHSKNVETLQLLLQINLMGMDVIVADSLLRLLKRLDENIPNFNDMIDCLVGAIKGIAGYKEILCNHLCEFRSNELLGQKREFYFSFMKRLLTLCPAVASEYRFCYGHLLLHEAAYYMSDIDNANVSDVIGIILAANPEAIRDKARNTRLGDLPIHVAVKGEKCRCSFKALDMLLSVYPESATMSNNKGDTIFHIYAKYCRQLDMNTFSHRFIYSFCSDYPELLHRRNNLGFTPLHCAMTICPIISDLDKMMNCQFIKIMCDIDPTIVKDVLILPPVDDDDEVDDEVDDEDDYDEFDENHFRMIYDDDPLPLLLLMGKLTISRPQYMDCLRLLLRLYPEAANIQNNEGRTPYDRAMSYRRTDYPEVVTSGSTRPEP